MNILYLSHLSGASYAGPTYSVPKQIEAQSKLDNVFWYNAVEISSKEWKNLEYYFDLTNYPNEKICELPEPFNKPDIVVVELFYNMFRSPMIKELIRGNLPYVIIPRGELTKKAQDRKFFKKKIANFIICRKYANKASAIEFLTNQEMLDSENKWNKNAIIIPNGTDEPNIKKTFFSKDSIKCVSIGRIEPFQKGLDILIEACSSIKNELDQNNCIIDIYGPDTENKKNDLENLIKNNGLGKIIKIHGPVYGENKKKILLDHDVFLIPSRFEGHPMALIEAMSYGLPCVATEGSNMKKEIEKYNSGWTSKNDVNSLINAIRHMILDKDKFFEKGQNSIKLSNLYKWANIAKISHDEYKNICQK